MYRSPRQCGHVPQRMTPGTLPELGRHWPDVNHIGWIPTYKVHTLTRHVYRDCMSARAWQRGHCQVMASLYQTHFTGINWWATRWATWCRISLTNFCESSHRTFSFRVHERTPLKWRLPQSATSYWFSVENVQVTDATIWDAGSREQDAR